MSNNRLIAILASDWSVDAIILFVRRDATWHNQLPTVETTGDASRASFRDVTLEFTKHYFGCTAALRAAHGTI
jgi:hypothetical protein